MLLKKRVLLEILFKHSHIHKHKLVHTYKRTSKKRPTGGSSWAMFSGLCGICLCRVWCVGPSGGNVGGERVQKEEGGRAQYAAGLSQRNSFTLASPTALID